MECLNFPSEETVADVTVDTYVPSSCNLPSDVRVRDDTRNDGIYLLAVNLHTVADSFAVSVSCHILECSDLVVTLLTIRSTDLEVCECRDIILDERLLRNSPTGRNAWEYTPTVLLREVLGTVETDDTLDHILTIVVVSKTTEEASTCSLCCRTSDVIVCLICCTCEELVKNIRVELIDSGIEVVSSEVALLETCESCHVVTIEIAVIVDVGVDGSCMRIILRLIEVRACEVCRSLLLISFSNFIILPIFPVLLPRLVERLNNVVCQLTVY